MKNDLLRTALFGVLSAGVAYGVAVYTKPSQAIVTVNAPATGWSTVERNPAKARRLAETIWPELEQREVDAITAAVKAEPVGKITIFCVDDSKCADLSLNLENAFESARWTTVVQNSMLLQPGIFTSSEGLAAIFNASTGGRFDVKVDPTPGAPGAYIAIGPRPQREK